MNLDGVPVAVLYNKSDLPGAVPEEKLEAMVRTRMRDKFGSFAWFSLPVGCVGLLCGHVPRPIRVKPWTPAFPDGILDIHLGDES